MPALHPYQEECMISAPGDLSTATVSEERVISHGYICISHIQDYCNILNCCNMLFVRLPLKTFQQLQLLQNAGAKSVARISMRVHIMPVLKDILWLMICFSLMILGFRQTFLSLLQLHHLIAALTSLTFNIKPTYSTCSQPVCL